MNIEYIQCTLIKKSNNSTLQQVTFIPKKFVKLNSFLSLKDDNGNWSHDWEIVKIGSSIFKFNDPYIHLFEMFI